MPRNATAEDSNAWNWRKTALTTTPLAVVGSLALSLGVADGAMAAESHTVQPGDTVTSIAIKHGLQTRDVLAWNRLSASSVIYPGQKLRCRRPAPRRSRS